MGRLIVIEGLDGSGKQTLTARLRADIEARGGRVATLAFPRYGASVHADLVKDALYGRLGDLSDSVYGTALLFSLDRRGALTQIKDAIAEHDVLLLDRYVSSNAAYGSARLGGPDVDTGFPQWLRDLEIDRFGLPVPDRQLLLATDVAVAAERAAGRAAGDTDRALDNFESDAALQQRTAAMYRLLAEQSYLSPWTVLRPGPDGQVTVPAELLG
ncbi:dTMP kinase [Nakamurella lactea]|uniref:dTMP kinase n=1 Tax=Nakamurella lactea TaxID=459515 RepID=UPI0004194017|nr:dTMP kinase [Nakamurella lactea]